MHVPVAAPTRVGGAEKSAVRRAVEAVLDSTSWILGEQVAAFEEEWADYVGTAATRVVGVASGTDALTLALLSLDLPPGSEVLVPADDGGYAATASRLAGLVPRVMDTGVTGPTVGSAGAAYGPAVTAMVVTHLHGDAVPLTDLDAWRRERGIALVEDCAQAHGLRVGGRHVGLVGDAAAFSFYPTKNLGAVGDAGAVLLATDDRAERVRALRQYGWGAERQRADLPDGRNSRLDALQAAVLRARLPFLDGRNERRRAIAAHYAEHVGLTGDPAVGVAHHAVALVENRDAIAAALAARGVDTAVHYPWLVTEMPGLAAIGSGVPSAAARRDRILSLPCFAELTDEEGEWVCRSLVEVGESTWG